jgi:hypothetical protein
MKKGFNIILVIPTTIDESSDKEILNVYDAWISLDNFNEQKFWKATA